MKSFFKVKFPQKDGMAIMSVLFLTVLMVMMTTSIIFISTNLLNMTGNSESRTQAIKAAEAGIAYAYAKLNSDGTWGIPDGGPSDDITVNLQDKTGSFTITFDSTLPYYSYNNLFSITKHDPSQTPGCTAKIIATGKSENGRAVERLQVIFVRGDIYSSTVVSQGKIIFGMAGEINVLGKKKGGTVQPGKMHSNWADPNDPAEESIIAGNQDVFIKTDVSSPDRGILSACGAIEITPDKYEGQKKAHAPREQINEIDIDDIISGAKADPDNKTTSLPSGTYTIMRELGIYNDPENPSVAQKNMGDCLKDISVASPLIVPPPEAKVTKADYIQLEYDRIGIYNKDGKIATSAAILDDFSCTEATYSDCVGSDPTHGGDYLTMTARGVSGKSNYSLEITYNDGSKEVFGKNNVQSPPVALSEPVSYTLNPDELNTIPNKPYIGDTLALKTPGGVIYENEKYAGIKLNSDGSIDLVDDRVNITGNSPAGDYKKSLSELVEENMSGSRDSFYLHVDGSVYKYDKIRSRYADPHYSFNLAGKNLYCDTHAIFEMEMTGNGNIVSSGKVNFMQRVNSNAINVLAKDDLQIDFIPGAREYYAKGLIYSGDDAKISVIGADNPEYENDYVKDMMNRKYIAKDQIVGVDKAKFAEFTELKYQAIGDGYSGYLMKSSSGLTIDYPNAAGEYNGSETYVMGNMKVAIVPLDPNSPPESPPAPSVDPNCPFGVVAYDGEGNVIGDNYGLTGNIVPLPSSLQEFATKKRTSGLYTFIKGKFDQSEGEASSIKIDGFIVGLNNRNEEDDVNGNNSIDLDSGSNEGIINIHQDLSYLAKLIELQGKRVKVRISSWQRI